MAPDDRRFPQSVYRAGAEPDIRFSLANERTFLAWIRTSLAFLAAGIALEALELPIEPGLRLAAALIFVILGTVAPIAAWVGWTRVERAIRTGRPLPSPALAGPIVAGTLIAGILLLVGLLVA